MEWSQLATIRSGRLCLSCYTRVKRPTLLNTYPKLTVFCPLCYFAKHHISPIMSEDSFWKKNCVLTGLSTVTALNSVSLEIRVGYAWKELAHITCYLPMSIGKSDFSHYERKTCCFWNNCLNMEINFRLCRPFSISVLCLVVHKKSDKDNWVKNYKRKLEREVQPLLTFSPPHTRPGAACVYQVFCFGKKS